MADPIWLLDKISAWHDGAGEGLELHEYLGWTRQAYAGWFLTGNPPVGSDHPDNDICDRCQYRRFEHPTDIAAEPLRLDFIGNPAPCWDFLDATPHEHDAP